MNERWYYRFLDQELGPVDFRSLQRLAVEGTLSGSDVVRRADSLEWLGAGSIPGLIPDHANAEDLAAMLASAPEEGERSSERRRGSDCYYRTRRGETGPIAFEELAMLAQTGEIGPDDQIRLSQDAHWIQADAVVGLFGASQPRGSEAGDELGDFEIVSEARAGAATDPGDRAWYCRILNHEIGPFTFDDVHAMAQSGQLGKSDDIREGERGEWKRAGLVVGLIPKAVRGRPKPAKAFDAERFLTEGAEPGEPVIQHIAPQRRAVAAPSLRSGDEFERAPDQARSPRGESSPAAETGERTERNDAAPGSRPVTPKRAVDPPPAGGRVTAPFRPPAVPPSRPPIVAPMPIPRARKSMGNPFEGLGGSLSSVLNRLTAHWKHVAVAVVLLGVAAVLYGGLPFNFSRGNKVYEETLAVWQRAQLLHQPETSDADWQSFKSETKPRVDQLKTELAEEANAKNRMLQLMLYCYRDCLPAILEGGPTGAPEKWKEMDGYMQEAGSLAQR